MVQVTVDNVVKWTTDGTGDSGFPVANLTYSAFNGLGGGCRLPFITDDDTLALSPFFYDYIDGFKCGVAATEFVIAVSKTPTVNTPGVNGELCFDDNFGYRFCTDVWKKFPLQSL